ncbi:hypothetical protein ACOTVT_05550 [Aliarcobacter butzleri]
MKKIFIFLTLTLSLYAHNLLMNVMDNEDNTITVIGEFSTGEKAAGAQVRLESLVSGEVLFKQRLPVESELTIDIPKEPYQVVLDGGPGHTIVKEGIEPLEGFNEELKAKINKGNSKLSKAQEFNNQKTTIENILSAIFYILCLLMFALALYFSFKNTNRIIEEMKQKSKI